MIDHYLPLKYMFGRSFFICCLCFPLALTAQLNLKQIGYRSYEADSATLAGCKTYVGKGGREYALVCTSRGLSIVDVSVPARPVERFKVPGSRSNWREVALWANFAYVGSEASGSGITIVDLRSLPDTVYSKVWFGNGEAENLIQRSHTVGCAAGYLYVYGSRPAPDGAVICNLSDPWNPKVEGAYREHYLHDGFVRGDTLWGSEIYEGRFSVIDIKDKTKPKVLVTQPTPAAFNHNSELTPDGRVLYTTDERANAPLAAFDVSNLNNIRLLDTYVSSRQPEDEVHNVRIKGKFLVNPGYGGQLTIVDATHPHNLIETGWASLGSSLVWDADPYLPSGIIVATAKNEGLFIFQPTYQQAAYLEGLTTDAVTGAPLAGVKVSVQRTNFEDLTPANGRFATGAAAAGAYDVQFQKNGYEMQLVQNVALKTGEITRLNVALKPLPLSAAEPDASVASIVPSLFTDQVVVKRTNQNIDRLRLVQVATGRVMLEKSLEGTETLINGLEEWPSGAYVAVFLQENKVLGARQVHKL
jgi:choice-of-anchor B domain-containing protein